MRKTSLFILAAALLLAGFTGCNKNIGETVEQIQTEEPFAGMANPWKYDVSEQDVENLTGRAFTVPEGACEVAYGIMEQGKLGEMNFKLDGKSFCARMKPSEGFEDISGLYYEWDAEGVDDIGGAEARIRQSFAGNISNVLWLDGNMMYSLYTSEGDKEGYEVLKAAKLMAGVPETSDAAEYDMYGYVVDKLPEEQYYNHYNVKGDNDEIFICNYNGNDELAEGTYVGMWQIGDGWTLEVIGDEGSGSPGQAEFTDENGITVTDMEITINTTDTCSFDFTLNNPSGRELTFDQTRITLENYDGTKLDPFADDRTPLDVSAKVERHSFPMDLRNIKNGDEISVYYDGKYVASIFVSSILVEGGPKATDGDLADPENFFEGIDIEEYTKMVMEQAKAEEEKNPVTLEKKDSSKDVNPVEGGLFMTADNVECRSLKLACPGDVFSFGVELYNNTGSDKTFDQTKFVIEKEEGVYVNPFVFEQVREPETVGGDTKRLWMSYTIYNPKGLEEGDEVSVYYDGVFITKLAAEK